MKDYQPNSHNCFVCGVKNEVGLRLRFENDGHGQVKVQTRICDQHQGYPGIAHGGIVAAMLDETMGRAGLSGIEAKFWFTGKMEIRYRVPVPLNTDLLLRGRILKMRGKTATAEGEVILPDGTLAVEGTAMLIAVPEEEVNAMLKDKELGWRVYSDEELSHEELSSNL